MFFGNKVTRKYFENMKQYLNDLSINLVFSLNVILGQCHLHNIKMQLFLHLELLS